MSVVVTRFSDGFRAILFFRGRALAYTVKARNNRNSAAADGWVLKSIVQV